MNLETTVFSQCSSDSFNRIKNEIILYGTLFDHDWDLVIWKNYKEK